MRRPFTTRTTRPRHTPGTMNKTEEAFAEVLQQWKLAGILADYRFESITFKIADDTRYSPDFFAWTVEGFGFLIDVKALTSAGKILTEDDANVKIKVCAEQWYMPVLIAAGRRTNGRYDWAYKWHGTPIDALLDTTEAR